LILTPVVIIVVMMGFGLDVGGNQEETALNLNNDR